MTRFLLGVVSALAVAAAVWWFVLGGTASLAPCGGHCGDGTTCEANRCVAGEALAAAPTGAEPEEKGRRRRGSRAVGRGRGGSGVSDRSGARGSGAAEQGEASGGEADRREAAQDWEGSDDLDLPAQEIDMEHGGEAQLSNTVIESTMGRSFGSIRRCILLAQSDRETPVHGRMSIGIRIRPSGEVGAVNVSPPGPLAHGDLGPCVRSVVGRIRFPRFDGREMVVTYPVTLE